MTSRLMKSFTVAVFSIFSLLISVPSFAKEGDGENGEHKKKSFNAQEVIFGHILDGHEFHFFDIIHKDGKAHTSWNSSAGYSYILLKEDLMFLCHQNFIMVT